MKRGGTKRAEGDKETVDGNNSERCTLQTNTCRCVPTVWLQGKPEINAGTSKCKVCYFDYGGGNTEPEVISGNDGKEEEIVLGIVIEMIYNIVIETIHNGGSRWTEIVSGDTKLESRGDSVTVRETFSPSTALLGRQAWSGTQFFTYLTVVVVVGWLLNVPATCKCISGTDLLRQFYVLPHWDRSCRPNFPSHPVTVYWHRADQSQCWPYNARRLAG